MGDKGELESEIMKRIQVEATKLGCRLWRNNVGAFKTNGGSWIRYGLQNPGGSDLIGFTPTRITQDMVGLVVPIFTAIEVKRPGENPTVEQTNFIDHISSRCGYAGVCRSPEELSGLLSMPMRK